MAIRQRYYHLCILLVEVLCKTRSVKREQKNSDWCDNFFEKKNEIENANML